MTTTIIILVITAYIASKLEVLELRRSGALTHIEDNVTAKLIFIASALLMFILSMWFLEYILGDFESMLTSYTFYMVASVFIYSIPKAIMVVKYPNAEYHGLPIRPFMLIISVIVLALVDIYFSPISATAASWNWFINLF